MWRVASIVESAKYPGPLVARNQCKKLERKPWKGMDGSGLNFKERPSIWGTSMSMRIVLVYMLMKGMPINVGAILRQNMIKFRNNLRWRFCYGGLITHFLRAQGIKEEAVDLTVAFHPDLTGKIVDVTQTKALDTSHEPVLPAPERQARDDSVMARMFGIEELQLWIGGRSITDEEMENLVDCYSLIECAAFFCMIGPAFLEPLDDDEATADEDMEDDDVDEEANALKPTLQPNACPLDSWRTIMRK
ncbi:hypothetical protein H5410_045105 [Solanum commersonii]|uniref:Uncharacterized protein n=1 Tax=Solanum commersonii TaxID=4109 RepID=A0A9J5XAK1_SOLCO|nr:hypothetical protein H5410_045105 [Solanum commersonii]